MGIGKIVLIVLEALCSLALEESDVTPCVGGQEDRLG